MNPPWKDNRYSLIQWTCSYHKRRYRIRKTASMQWYNPRLWSYRKTWRNVTHPSDVSASRCRGSLFFPSNSGQESSAAAVLACAIVPSEKQTRGRAWLESHVYLSIFLSINLSICLSIYHFFYPSIYRANYLSIYLSICLSINQILSLYIYISLSLSVYLSTCLSVYLSVYVSTHLFLYLSWYLTICLCVYVSICLSRHLFL